MIYHIRRGATPSLNADWNDPAWNIAETLAVNHFLPESTDHRPKTIARVLHNESGLHGIFHVQDRYVRCTRTEYFDEVWKDSCVEFFLERNQNKGYINFEFNCGGAFLASYIEDWTRVKDGPLKKSTPIPAELGQTIRVATSLPRLIKDEITQPTDWTLQFFIPMGLLQIYFGPIDNLGGQTWRGNFFKCAEEVSHPHWAAWSPVGEFNFHLPEHFGKVIFEV